MNEVLNKSALRRYCVKTNPEIIPLKTVATQEKIYLDHDINRHQGRTQKLRFGGASCKNTYDAYIYCKNLEMQNMEKDTGVLKKTVHAITLLWTTQMKKNIQERKWL
jgi:hypothetical protein